MSIVRYPTVESKHCLGIPFQPNEENKKVRTIQYLAQHKPYVGHHQSLASIVFSNEVKVNNQGNILSFLRIIRSSKCYQSEEVEYHEELGLR